MNAIEKAKEALEMALREHNDFMRQADLPTGSKVIEEAIAALEAEKPAEDANDIVIEIRSYNTVPNGQCFGDPYKIAIESASSLIQQYAEAYHAKRCEECQNKIRTCNNCGNEDGDDTGACDKCRAAHP